MCNKKERKRYRRWYLFPVSTLGAVYFAVHDGTGRLFFFRGGTGRFFFFRGGTGRGFFFPRRDGVAFFFFFDGTRRGGVFFFEGRDGTVVFGGGNFLAGRGKIVTPSRQRRFKPSRQPSM